MGTIVSTHDSCATTMYSLLLSALSVTHRISPAAHSRVAKSAACTHKQHTAHCSKRLSQAKQVTTSGRAWVFLLEASIHNAGKVIGCRLQRRPLATQLLEFDFDLISQETRHRYINTELMFVTRLFVRCTDKTSMHRFLQIRSTHAS